MSPRGGITSCRATRCESVIYASEYHSVTNRQNLSFPIAVPSIPGPSVANNTVAAVIRDAR